MAINPFRERQLLRLQEVERKRIAAEAAKDQPRQRLSTRLSNAATSTWKVIAAAMVGLTVTASAVVFVAVFFEALAEKTLIVRALPVPKVVAEAGFTPDVAALRLRDTIEDLVTQAHTSVPVIAHPLLWRISLDTVTAESIHGYAWTAQPFLPSPEMT